MEVMTAILLERRGSTAWITLNRPSALNAITHPRIAARTLARRAELEAEGHPIACYEAALLVENGIADAFRPLVVVALQPEEQLARLVAREHISEDEARQRLAAQLPLEKKIALADFVVWNDGPRDTLPDKIRPILEAIRARSQRST